MALTAKRDLRTGTPVWGAYSVPSIAGRRLSRSLSVHTVIIGAGISGSLLAQSLSEAGIKPVIIERRRRALLGSTAASTALLQFELDTPLSKLTSTIGRRKAEGVWLASRDAVNELRTRTRRLGIRAHLETRPSLYLAGNVLNAKGLAREVKMRQHIGLASEYLDRRTLRHHFGIDRSAALLNHANAEANPLELSAGYLRAAMHAGARLYTSLEVVDIDSHRAGTTLSLNNGRQVQAKYVIFCTGYELPKIIPPTDQTVLSTWAIATRPQPGAIWPQRALIWEASEPYLYLRSTVDGRVICGGEDEEFADPARRDALLETKAARLERKLHRMMPTLDPRAALAWTGSFGGSPVGMPTIGEIPGYPRCFAVMGFGGNGITFSMLATQILTAALTGRKLAAAKLFQFR